MRPEDVEWSSIHSVDESWRKKIIGDINEAFVVPRYVELFYSYFGRDSALNVIELGAGTGELSSRILDANEGQIAHWTASEHFDEGVEWLKKKGFDAVKASACDTGFADRSYDVSVSLDVMHHVPNQRQMAREMMRIAKGRCLLVESNGLSVLRKVMELTPGHRAAGERSFTPWTYRRFFEGHGYAIRRFEIFPFLFPFRVPRRMLPALVHFNRRIEDVPLARWLCSSVAIYLEYDDQPS
jgi:hypothetical protein